MIIPVGDNFRAEQLNYAERQKCFTFRNITYGESLTVSQLGKIREPEHLCRDYLLWKIDSLTGNDCHGLFWLKIGY